MRVRASVHHAYQLMRVRSFDNNSWQNDFLVLSRNDLIETITRNPPAKAHPLLMILQNGARLPVPYELLRSESQQLLPVLLGSDQCAFVDTPVPSAASVSAPVSTSYARHSSTRQQQPSSSRGVSNSITTAAKSSSNVPPNANFSRSSTQPVASISSVTAPKLELRNGPIATANNPANSQCQAGSSLQAAQQLQLSAVAASDEELVRLVYQVVYECICLRCWAFKGEMRFDLREDDHRLPIVELLDGISQALEARNAAAFEMLLEAHSFLRPGRTELLKDSTAINHIALMNVAVRQTPLLSAAGGGPLAAPQQQLTQQSHLTSGRQPLIALSQQNGSPPLTTSVVSPLARPDGLPNSFVSPTQETQDSAVRLG